MFRKFRILFLLFVLATVGLAAWRATTSLSAWEHTVHVALYPIAADNSPATAAYLATLENDSFEDIGQWIEQESRRYGKSVLQPVVVRVAPVLREQPPLPVPGGSALDNMLWSLKLRWWATQHDAIAGPKPQVRLFVLYHDPERNAELPHSTGLSKGQLGLIHAFSSRRQHRQNNVVIAHELLHTFGASDKYDLTNSQPIHPHGYAEPDKSPLLPQRSAEIMGGRIPVTEQRADIPASLLQTMIGELTAREIGLIK
ncbi:hypothetical protein BJN45_07605 [Azonexus hydrophilus]|uniref:Peptidase M10 metallopeptidase domain-containing protein n=1 Tax=Azonexus hydrophilus TaxID=418702 RepID=A0A1R1I8U9_9RHOO|nr:hypothetical protein [Azonexus hydrophilus]OMG55009.1 hypothetical protein BJN45_07605 [Azonexus hydrophilus]